MHNPPRILIVDDNETNRDILLTRLGTRGYDLTLSCSSLTRSIDFTRATSEVWSTGFVRYSSAPASSPATTSLLSVLAVTRMIGMNGRLASALSRLVAAMPSSLGIMTSSRIRSGRLLRATSRGVAELAAGWRKHGHELGFGMGIAHGYATLGRIGFEGRFDYSAIGTVVNLAARLCSQAQAGQILVDPKVHAAIEILTDTEPAGELTLKGLSRAIKAFNIAGFRAVPAS